MVDGPSEGSDDEGALDDEIDESIEHPAKVMRVGTMMRQLLEEVRLATLDEPSRDRLREIYETSVTELGTALSVRPPRGAWPVWPCRSPRTWRPPVDELRIAQAQLVGLARGPHSGNPGHPVRSADGRPAAVGRDATPGELPNPEGRTGNRVRTIRPGTYL